MTTYLEIPPSGGGGTGAVDSVNGQTGTVVLTSDNIPEGSTNLYFTSARARSALSATAPIQYNSTTGAFLIAQATALADGYLSSADWTTFNSKEGPITPGTTAQYYRGDKTFQTLDTAVVPENGNLYYTNARARLALSASLPISYNNSTGALTFVPYTPAESSVAANTSTGVGASGVYGSVTSLTLAAGTYVIEGVAGFHENGADLTNGLQCGISDAADGSTIDEFDTVLAPFLVSSTSDAILATPRVTVTLGSSTTYYLNTRFYYTSGTPQHRGRLRATRIS